MTYVTDVTQLYVMQKQRAIVLFIIEPLYRVLRNSLTIWSKTFILWLYGGIHKTTAPRYRRQLDAWCMVE